jgi:hypothetical protein
MFDTVQVWKINHCTVSWRIFPISLRDLKALHIATRCGNKSDLPTFINKNTYKLSDKFTRNLALAFLNPQCTAMPFTLFL